MAFGGAGILPAFFDPDFVELIYRRAKDKEGGRDVRPPFGAAHRFVLIAMPFSGFLTFELSGLDVSDEAHERCSGGVSARGTGTSSPIGEEMGKGRKCEKAVAIWGAGTLPAFLRLMTGA